LKITSRVFYIKVQEANYTTDSGGNVGNFTGFWSKFTKTRQLNQTSHGLLRDFKMNWYDQIIRNAMQTVFKRRKPSQLLIINDTAKASQF